MQKSPESPDGQSQLHLLYKPQCSREFLLIPPSGNMSKKVLYNWDFRSNANVTESNEAMSDIYDEGCLIADFYDITVNYIQHKLKL